MMQSYVSLPQFINDFYILSISNYRQYISLCALSVHPLYIRLLKSPIPDDFVSKRLTQYNVMTVVV